MKYQISNTTVLVISATLSLQLNSPLAKNSREMDTREVTLKGQLTRA